MADITVQVAPGTTAWTYEDMTLEGGAHHEVKTTKKNEGALAAAVAAGVLIVVDGDLDLSSVEPDEDSLAKQEAAQAAREPFYADRDAAVDEAVREVLDQNAALDTPQSGEVLDAQITEARDATLAEYSDQMEAAAQAAVEGK